MQLTEDESAALDEEILHFAGYRMSARDIAARLGFSVSCVEKRLLRLRNPVPEPQAATA